MLLLKDIGMLAEFIHTCVIVMYHGLMERSNSYDGIGARTQLAVLDHNHNVVRNQAQTKEGANKHILFSPNDHVRWI